MAMNRALFALLDAGAAANPTTLDRLSGIATDSAPSPMRCRGNALSLARRAGPRPARVAAGSGGHRPAGGAAASMGAVCCLRSRSGVLGEFPLRVPSFLGDWMISLRAWFGPARVRCWCRIGRLSGSLLNSGVRRLVSWFRPALWNHVPGCASVPGTPPLPASPQCPTPSSRCRPVAPAVGCSGLWQRHGPPDAPSRAPGTEPGTAALRRPMEARSRANLAQ